MKYKLKPTKKQLNIMKIYWKKFLKEEDIFWGKITKLELEMANNTKIKDLEFFWCDNEIVGIGNVERTMKLVQRELLE